nr:MAG TPA: hypothetical protein [Caudoviricetes sp.]
MVDSCYCFLVCYNGIKLKCKISRGVKFSRLFVMLKNSSRLFSGLEL